MPRGQAMNVHPARGLAIALDDLVVRVVEPLPCERVLGMCGDAADEDEPLALVDRLAARMAGWAGLLEGRSIPSFGPFSTSDGSLALCYAQFDSLTSGGATAA